MDQMYNSMPVHEKHRGIKYLLLILLVVVALIVFVAWMLKYRASQGPSQKEKIEIINKLNADTENATPVSQTEKESIIKTMNDNSQKETPLTPEQKKALVGQSGQ
jgi:cytoskeletal protein RodZ